MKHLGWTSRGLLSDLDERVSEWNYISARYEFGEMDKLFTAVYFMYNTCASLCRVCVSMLRQLQITHRLVCMYGFQHRPLLNLLYQYAC